MKATLDALDERLRRLLTQPCGRAARIACAALVLLGFAGVMMTRSLALGHHAATAVMMCLPLAAMLVFAMRIVREHEQGALGALLLDALCAAANWRAVRSPRGCARTSANTTCCINTSCSSSRGCLCRRSTR